MEFELDWDLTKVWPYCTAVGGYIIYQGVCSQQSRVEPSLNTMSRSTYTSSATTDSPTGVTVTHGPEDMWD